MFLSAALPGILILFSICVEINGNLETKVVNGTEAAIEDYPFIVGIFKYGYKYRCGGSIISDKYVLTAAHCFIFLIPQDKELFCGSRYRAGNDSTIFEIEKVIMHDDYFYKHEKTILDHDIALVRIKGTFEFSNTIKTIELATEDFEINVGDMCSVAGWGYISESGPGSNVLLEAQVPIYNHDECAKMYRAEKGGRNMVTDMMICAGYENGGVDTCKGDSGGPLVLRNTLIGVISFGIVCGSVIPSVYQDVRKYRQWILDTMKND